MNLIRVSRVRQRGTFGFSKGRAKNCAFNAPISKARRSKMVARPREGKHALSVAYRAGVRLCRAGDFSRRMQSADHDRPFGIRSKSHRACGSDSNAATPQSFRLRRDARRPHAFRTGVCQRHGCVLRARAQKSLVYLWYGLRLRCGRNLRLCRRHLALRHRRMDLGGHRLCPLVARPRFTVSVRPAHLSGAPRAGHRPHP